MHFVNFLHISILHLTTYYNCILQTLSWKENKATTRENEHGSYLNPFFSVWALK